MKKDEKDAGSRSWNALIFVACFESGYFALYLRSRNRSRRVGGERQLGAARFVFCFCFVVRRRRLRGLALLGSLSHDGLRVRPLEP